MHGAMRRRLVPWRRLAVLAPIVLAVVLAVAAVRRALRRRSRPHARRTPVARCQPLASESVSEPDDVTEVDGDGTPVAGEAIVAGRAHDEVLVADRPAAAMTYSVSGPDAPEITLEHDRSTSAAPAPSVPAQAESPIVEPEIDLARIEADLAGVEAALRRLDEGTYWSDEVTGEPLDAELLLADPVARRNT